MYQVYGDGPFVPKNYMEELVDGKLDNLMGQAAMCCCHECRSAVKEQALSKLPPLHVTCISEDVHARFAAMALQMQADIITAILCSVETVRKRPQHCSDQT